MSLVYAIAAWTCWYLSRRWHERVAGSSGVTAHESGRQPHGGVTIAIAA